MDIWATARRIAQEEGIDPELFARQINAESGGRVNAVSSSGAIGPGQLLESTAKGLGVDPWDPVQNLRGAARYYKAQLKRFGTPELALAAYNAGPGSVQKYGGIPPFAETQNYVKKIMGGMAPPPGGGSSMAATQQPSEQRASLIAPDSEALPAVRTIATENVAASVAAAGLGLDTPKSQQASGQPPADQTTSLAGASIAAALGLPEQDGKAVVQTVATNAQPTADGSVRMAGSVPAATGGEISIVELGRKLQGLGLKVAEHPEFGGVGQHSKNSRHYSKEAVDLTIQPGSPLLAGRPDSDWRALTAKKGALLKAAIPGAEIFHPGDDPVGGHNSHIHLALPGGKTRITPQLAKLLQLS